MPDRRQAYVVAALLVLAPLACATQPERAQQHAMRESSLARVPANAPGGVFANGLWLGEMTGELPLLRVGTPGWGAGGSVGLPAPAQTVTRRFDIEVDAWRDSARVAFMLRETSALRRGRTMPRDLRVDGKKMTFTLANVLGWSDVTCQLVETRTETWDGPCVTKLGERAAWMTIGMPRYATR